MSTTTSFYVVWMLFNCSQRKSLDWTESCLGYYCRWMISSNHGRNSVAQHISPSSNLTIGVCRWCFGRCLSLLVVPAVAGTALQAAVGTCKPAQGVGLAPAAACELGRRCRRSYAGAYVAGTTLKLCCYWERMQVSGGCFAVYFSGNPCWSAALLVFLVSPSSAYWDIPTLTGFNERWGNKDLATVLS